MQCMRAKTIAWLGAGLRVRVRVSVRIRVRGRVGAGLRNWP